MTTPTQIPAQLLAGDTWAWTRELASYPAGTWSATYYFENADANFSAAASASGSSFSVTVAAATTAGYRPGRYKWRMLVTSGGARYTADEGWLDVLPDPAAAGNVDHRSTARVMLENVEAYLRDPSNLNAANYTINGRALGRWRRADLIAERDALIRQVQSEEEAERLKAGKAPRRRYGVRFNRV